MKTTARINQTKRFSLFPFFGFRKYFFIWIFMFIYFYFFLSKTPYFTDLFIPAIIITMILSPGWRIWKSVIRLGDFTDYLFALGLIFISILILYFSKNEVFKYSIPASTPIVKLLFYSMINGLREEILFRFALIPLSLSSAYEKYISVIVSSLFFGWMHYFVGLPSGSLGVVLTTCFSLAMGALYIRSKSLFLMWLIHSAMDFSIFLLIRS